MLELQEGPDIMSAIRVMHLVYLWACDVLKLYAVVCMHHVLYEVLLAV